MTRDEDLWDVARALFDAARGLPVEEREDLLRRACPDPVMRGEVDVLLRTHEALEGGAGSGFLESLDPLRVSALLGAEEDPQEDRREDRRDAADAEALAPGARVGRYRIVRRLGSGGMAVVYLARDPRLGRPVALKLLPRHLSLDASARRRFEDEARAASALNHPHIVTIYEIGETDSGRLFIAMAYCDGETLRQRLERGPLPVASALTVATGIAEGLAAAHAGGIVHRDIKPGNILLPPGGGVRIVDFGIAKISGGVITRAGSAVGTAAYMSPEQTRGRASEPGTDVWSLGVTLYEMLTGRRPFLPEDEQALIHAIRHDEPEPIRRLRPEVPGAVAAVVERCLRKEASSRYRDGAAVLAALRSLATPAAAMNRKAGWRKAPMRLGGVAAVLVLLLGGGFFLSSRTHPGDAGPKPPPATTVSRLVVLPLIDDSANPEDDYLAEGLTAELVTRLSGVPDLRVIARSSLTPFEDQETDIPRIGQELDVASFIRGTVRRAEEGVRMTVQLIDAHSEELLWAAEYEVDLGNAPDMYEEIVERVVETLDVQVGAGQRSRIARQGTDVPEAYTSYLKGRYFLGKLDAASFRQARDHFERALDLDPTFARAWSGLADAFQYLTSVSAMHAEEGYPRARAAAQRALELEPGLAQAHAALATALSMYYWDPGAAEMHFRRAIELDPSYGRARRMYASHLRNHARFEEALAEARTAQELDPLSGFPRFEEAAILYAARRYDAAIEQCRRLLDTAPGSSHAYLLLALAHAQGEQYEEALSALRQGDPEGIQPDAHAIRGYVYAQMGRREDALRMLEALEGLGREQTVSAFHRVAIHVGLGDYPRALDMLEQAADERTPLIRLLKVEPVFDPLRTDPRFQALLERVALSD